MKKSWKNEMLQNLMNFLWNDKFIKFWSILFLDFSSYIHIYIYIYVCVCVCGDIFSQPLDNDNIIYPSKSLLWFNSSDSPAGNRKEEKDRVTPDDN